MKKFLRVYTTIREWACPECPEWSEATTALLAAPREMVKDLNMSLDSAPFGAITRVKRDSSIREVVQQPASWTSFRVKWIKAFCKIK